MGGKMKKSRFEQNTKPLEHFLLKLQVQIYGNKKLKVLVINKDMPTMTTAMLDNRETLDSRGRRVATFFYQLNRGSANSLQY